MQPVLKFAQYDPHTHVKGAGPAAVEAMGLMSPNVTGST